MKRGRRAAGRWSGLWQARLGRICYAAYASAVVLTVAVTAQDLYVSPPLTPPDTPLPPLPPPNLISGMRAEDDESLEGG
jgi:hypothetical protein